MKKLVEIWKDIPGYEGHYQVSNFGRVKSVARLAKHYRGGTLQKKEQILKLALVGNPGALYYAVSLCIEGRHLTKTVHRLVATCFKRNLKNLPQVNHKDRNRLNNNVSNLEWVTQRENESHKNIGSSTSKYPGVHAKGSRWIAQIRVNKITHRLGSFIEEKQAVKAYRKALKIHNIINRYAA